MKFWILISYFRSEQHVLQKVLSNPKWRMYAEWYKLMPSLVERQERAVLDSEVPTDLCREALSLSTMKYRVRGESLEKARGDVSEKEGYLTALEVYRRFGGDCLEEVEESGLWRIAPRSQAT